MTAIASLAPAATETLQPPADAPAAPGFATLIAALSMPVVAFAAPATSSAPSAGDDDGPGTSAGSGTDNDPACCDGAGPAPIVLQSLPLLPLPAPSSSTPAVPSEAAAAAPANVPPFDTPRPIATAAAPGLATTLVPITEALPRTLKRETIPLLPAPEAARDLMTRPILPTTVPSAVQAPPKPAEQDSPAGAATLLLPVSAADTAPAAPPPAGAPAAPLPPAAIPAKGLSVAAVPIPAEPVTPVSSVTAPPSILVPALPATLRQRQLHLETVPEVRPARAIRRTVAPLLDTGSNPITPSATATQQPVLAAAIPAAPSAVSARVLPADPAPAAASPVAEQAPGSFAVATDRLGPVQVMLDARDARVSVQLAADTPAAGQLLAAHPARLADAVAASGQRLDALAVDVRSGGGQQQERQPPESRLVLPPVQRPVPAPRTARADRFA